MRRWRRTDLKRLFVGQHIVNGISVGVGVISVALAASAILGFVAGQRDAGSDFRQHLRLSAPLREKARTMGFGFGLALIATTATQLALPWPAAALLTIGTIAFAGGMITGMGRWAIALGLSTRLLQRNAMSRRSAKQHRGECRSWPRGGGFRRARRDRGAALGRLQLLRQRRLLADRRAIGRSQIPLGIEDRGDRAQVDGEFVASSAKAI